MKNAVLFFTLLSMVVVLFSCNENKDIDNGNNGTLPEPIRLVLPESEIRMTKSGSIAAMNLFSIINSLQEEDENVVLSPLSLHMALAMVWNGANGETKEAIQQTLCLSDFSPEEVNAYFKKLRETFVKTDPTVQLALANSIWYRLGFSVKSGFIQTNKTYYDAEVSEIDFSNTQTPEIINQWCSDHTNGRIKEMIETIPTDAAMYLLNALYFKGTWANEHGFSKPATSDERFTKADGSQTTVKMMQQNNTLPYYKDEYLTLTALPYGNNAFSMLFILPNSGVSFDALATRFKQEGYWEQCLASRETYDVDLYIPRFKIEYDITLNEALMQSGMGIAFTTSADFSGISDTPLCISKVKQKTYIEVNEEGTEAAAVTAIEMKFTSVGPPPEPKKVTFRADRPFLFAIQENSTGTILFMGKIGNPL
ncbi:MAG: serpin family protein [Dysgonamonadaceae bacterium]|jgi:serpin B|nr:serpin family protein [Dysgonamonadaceae bacterium]